MKKSLVAILLFYTFNFLNAQQVTLKWAEKIKTRGEIDILGGKKGKYYTTHVSGKDNSLIGRIYDKKMNLKTEKEINFNLANKKYFYNGAYFLDGKLLHFIRDNIRRKGKSAIYAGFSDFDLNTSDKLLVVDETEDNKKTLNFGLRSISPDSTKVLVYHEMRGRKKDPNKLLYKVYNSNITNVVSERIVSLPIKSKNYSTRLVKVDNFGNVYLLARIDKERKERKKGHSKYYFKLVVFGKDKSIKEFDFDYPENDISFFDMIPSKDNKFFCTGFLTNLRGGRKKLISDEMFLAKLDCRTLKLGESEMIKVEGLYPEKTRRSSDYVPYKVREIYEKSNKGYSIVAEQYKLVVRTNKYGTTYIYFYCDIACIQTDKNLKVKSVTRIPKFQKNAKNPSIISTFKNDKTYIVYEDLTKNLEATTDKKTKRSTASIFKSRSKNSLFLLTIDKNGKSKKEIIYSYKDSKIKPNILRSLDLGKGKILMSGNDQLGLLSIK